MVRFPLLSRTRAKTHPHTHMTPHHTATTMPVTAWAVAPTAAAPSSSATACATRPATSRSVTTTCMCLFALLCCSCPYLQCLCPPSRLFCRRRWSVKSSFFSLASILPILFACPHPVVAWFLGCVPARICSRRLLSSPRAKFDPPTRKRRGDCGKEIWNI